ncbi:Protein FAR1-RELATED SEQUENCE 4 [Glycine soja]|nr:Protein FAR1-RELATED SEQUENCE 4 [Glycine soja]
MLGDYDVGHFEELWDEMIHKFELHDNKWMNDLYERRKMWATSHIRGHFFAGLRTTSRCEAFHNHLGNFVHSKIGFSIFVEQFQMCLTYFRFRETEADLESDYGSDKLQTRFHSLERCFCMKMESFGMPCDHIVVLLVFLDFQMAEVAPRYEDDYNDVVNILVRQVMKLGKNMGTKGCGAGTSSNGGKSKQTNRCGKCGLLGHSKRSCTKGRTNVQVSQSTGDGACTADMVLLCEPHV